MLTILTFSPALRAQTPTYSYSSGTSSNAFPMNSTSSNMCQWLLTPADFTPTAPTSGILITTVYLRAANTVSAGSTFTNLTIKLNANSSLAALTSGPWLTGLTTVYTQATTTISGWVTGDWIPFVLPTSVFYNGTDNIEIEVSQTGYTGTGMSMRQGTGTGNRRIYGGVTSANSTGADASRLNFGFDAIPAACSGQPSNPGIASPAMNPATPVCSGGTTSITGSNPNLGNGITMQWQTSASATGPWTNTVGGSGGTTLTYTTPSLTANRYFRLSVTCTNSNLTSYSPAYLVIVGAPQPGVISGSTNFCPGDALTYSVPNVPGTTYAWTLPTGWTGTSTTNSITVTPGTAAGNISVTASSPCGTSVQRSQPIIRGSAPAPVATVTGSRFICSNTAQAYSVSPVAGATSYAWTLPSGWTGSSATAAITANNTATSGNVTVSALNGCGSSAPTSIPVSIISSLANPGPITGNDTVCSGSLQTYTIQPVNGATSYVWTLPSGWSGSTTGTSIQAFPGTITDSIRVTAYVSCATSPISARRINAVQTVTPTVAVSTGSTRLCSGLPVQFNASASHAGSAPVYTWRVNGNAVSSAGPAYTTNTLADGDQVTVTLATNAACATARSVVSSAYTASVIASVTPGISINTTPPTAICRGTMVDFRATATAGGTQPSYQWSINGNPVIGANSLSFSSNALGDGDTVSVSMSGNAVCARLATAQSNKIGIHVVDSILPTVVISVDPGDEIRPGMEVGFEATETGGGMTPAYQWQLNGVNIPFATDRIYRTTGLIPGDHISVRMHSYLSCATRRTVFSNIIAMKDGALGVNNAAGAELKLYPNPSNGSFVLSGAAVASGSTIRVEVLNSLGQMVHLDEIRGSGGVWERQIILPGSTATGLYQIRMSVRDAGGIETAGQTIQLMLQR